ncbi:acyl-CoA dehydrogenase family protein [Paraburkholderia tropica]|uniref:Alkylation response protein AidB-like acyl-CoA dehydrogenase n=1 Tax=Paraburkholderia tropica TaxID=92647 RepID=A0ABX5MNV0_9BURK|nr:acyl-CoA dehydrogenase family protein [Paraburkholderia tropica]MBB3001791.1 alkylation response protein AidB-like acyl-CoA dehydrogenase [Paraburkholderia tropica]MBB6321013.1 alkylation response protein AidB-like acyl-CoA dehydrogenase [Paraburkholderia tropica]MDE1144740.1 acyl-CoA dehydrogenase family protein [Paraburkholderia tropica]PXX15908.1 alkylation response protein AidB-like acyl-CoA dehydrogenase [Paraburkholderia tropica]PZW82167.1 alkylation response protein AidB-like acyl-Co
MAETSTQAANPNARVSALSASLGLAATIDEIAATAAQREREQRLPHEAIAALKALGFGALRLPVEDGGHGVSLSGLFTVARDLAAADSNIAHAFRNHLWQVEAALQRREHPFHAHVLDLARQRKTVGLSFVESDATAAGARSSRVLSRLEWDAGKQVYLGSGDKVYATGNLYNDAFVGQAIESRANATVQYVLERGPGVATEDDWRGFGQRLTGSGTARFRDVVVRPEHVYPPDPPKAPDAAPWGFTFHQVYLTNCIAGIVRRVVQDAVDVLRTRQRNFYHGEAAQPADEPALQALLGRIRAYAASIEATADRAVQTLQDALTHHGTPDEYASTLAATLTASEAKVVIDDLAPQVASWLIDLGSGSAVSSVAALDRHWRNIKVIASHNPRLYKERLLGQNLLNGQLPPTGAFF